MYCHWGLTYFPYLEPVLTLNFATLVSNKLFPGVNVINFRVGSLDLLIAWMAFVILSMDVTSVPFALNDLFRVHGNGQSQLSSSSKSTIASAKAQQQMNSCMYVCWAREPGQMHNNHHHKRSLVMYVPCMSWRSPAKRVGWAEERRFYAAS